MLDEFVVMPNHMHGILVITEHANSGLDDSTPTKKRTLGQLIGYFKHEITKEINAMRRTGLAKVLQRDYFDRVIRNEREWNAIAVYIQNNPANWNADFDNPTNLQKRLPPQSVDEYWHDAGL